MKVRCDRVLPTADGQTKYQPAIRIGATYDVVSIDFIPSCDPLLRIYDEFRIPSIWSSRMFAIVSPELNVNWRINIVDDGIVILGPAAFLMPGYWERFFDGDGDANKDFENEFLRYRVVDDNGE